MFCYDSVPTNFTHIVDYPSPSYETSTIIMVSFSILMPTYPCYQPANNKWPREPFWVPRVVNPIGITVKPGQSSLPLVDRKGIALSCLAPYLFMGCYSLPPRHWLICLALDTRESREHWRLKFNKIVHITNWHLWDAYIRYYFDTIILILILDYINKTERREMSTRTTPQEPNTWFTYTMKKIDGRCERK